MKTYVKYFALHISLFISYSQVLYAEEVDTNAAYEKDAWPQTGSSDSVSEDDYFGEVPKVLTVSRLSQSKADAPSAVTVIDHETIRAAGIVDLAEIFRLVPGFYVAKNAGFIYNSNHVVSYHGMASAYPGSMQVLINGRSVYTPLFGGVQWSELPISIDDIDRIEITRGPNAASYGANSFFGVINIITKNPADSLGSSVKLTHGDGRNEAFYRHAGEIDDFNYRVTVGYREDDGLENRNDFKRTQLLNVQADKRLNATNEIDFELGITGGERADGEAVKDNRFFVPRTRDILNHYELVRWRHNVSDDSDFSLQAYHSLNSSDDQITTVNLRPFLPAVPALLSATLQINNDIEMERFDIEAQHTFAPANNLRVVWGGNIRLDTTFAPYWLGTSATDHFNLQRLFGHAEWRINDQFLMNIGSMVEHNDFTGTDISPRASLNFKLTPNQTLRLGISSATRTPNYIEEKFNNPILIPTTTPASYLIQTFADTGDVNPERILSKEIGYLGQMGNLNVDARLFDDEIRDVLNTKRMTLTLPPTIVLAGQLPRIYFNGTDAQVRGFETQIKYRLFKQTQIIANYAHVKISGDKTLPTDFTISMPENTFSALITHQFDSNWDASYAFYQTGAVSALGDGAPVGLNRRSDVRLARKFVVNRASGEVSLAVENLFNEHYHEYALYNTLGRRAVINCNLDF